MELHRWPRRGSAATPSTTSRRPHPARLPGTGDRRARPGPGPPRPARHSDLAAGSASPRRALREEGPRGRTVEPGGAAGAVDGATRAPGEAIPLPDAKPVSVDAETIGDACTGFSDRESADEELGGFVRPAGPPRCSCSTRATTSPSGRTRSARSLGPAARDPFRTSVSATSRPPPDFEEPSSARCRSPSRPDPERYLSLRGSLSLVAVLTSRALRR